MHAGRTRRLLFVSHSSHLYGAERSLLTLVEGLRSTRGYHISVLLPGPGPLASALTSQGFEARTGELFRWIGDERGPSALRWRLERTGKNLIAAVKARRWAATWQPDLIYSNSIACPVGMLLAAASGTPHVWHVRELVAEQLAATFDLGERRAMACVDRWTDQIICNSQVVADRLSSFISTSKLTVVHNGFDFGLLTPPDAARKYDRTVRDAAVVRLAIIGSVQPSKGQEDGIRALAMLSSTGRAFSLDIIGDGPAPYREALQSLAAELSVQDKVTFHGYSPDVVAGFHGLAMTLMTSRFEVFGRVVVESLAHGTPVIASRAGGIPDVISENATGLCYQPGNPEDLARKIVQLVNDRKVYEALVVGGWHDVTRRFSKDRYVDEVGRIIDQTLER